MSEFRIRSFFLKDSGTKKQDLGGKKSLVPVSMVYNKNGFHGGKVLHMKALQMWTPALEVSIFPGYNNPSL